MAKKDFSTIYKVEHNSGAVLQNEIFPRFLMTIMSAHSMVQNKEREGIVLLFSTLRTMFPPLKKFIRKYEEVRQKIKECETLKNEWLKYKPTAFPTKLTEKLDLLYEEFWTAYHDSGAGLAVHQVDATRDKRVYDYLTGKAPSQSPT